MYAARIGSILVTDKGEGNPLGTPYKLTIADVEKMSDDELAATASAQAAALRPHIGTYDMFKEHVERIIARAINEDRGIKLNADGTKA
jgi:hypothetical protein